MGGGDKSVHKMYFITFVFLCVSDIPHVYSPSDLDFVREYCHDLCFLYDNSYDDLQCAKQYSRVLL